MVTILCLRRTGKYRSSFRLYQRLPFQHYPHCCCHLKQSYHRDRVEADRLTYLLGRRFSMPIENGARDAIAVSFDTGKKLLSAYTLMVDLIVLQIWTLIVLAALSMFIRKAHSPNIGATSAAIWNSQGSAFSVLTSMAKYFLHMNRKRDRLYVLSWMFAAAGLIALAYAISIWVP